MIIGGGIAGLACARRLHEGQRPFLLITEDIGGRIRPSGDGAVNLGAYYVRSDYTQVNQFVEQGRRIKRRDILRGNEDGSFTRSDLPLLAISRRPSGFSGSCVSSAGITRPSGRRCLVISQAEAIRADPFLRELYHEPALSFVERHRIGHHLEDYLEPAIRATGFTSLGELTAFTLLVGVLPTVVPMFEYTFDLEALVTGFEEAIATRLGDDAHPPSGGFSIRTRNGASVGAANVVVATPSDVAAGLLDLGPLKRPISAHMFLVRGDLRRPWSTAPLQRLSPRGRALRDRQAKRRLDPRQRGDRRSRLHTHLQYLGGRRAAPLGPCLPPRRRCPSRVRAGTGPLPDRRPQRL